jgi:hypothetical protein
VSNPYFGHVRTCGPFIGQTDLARATCRRHARQLSGDYGRRMDRPALIDALRDRDAVLRAFVADDGSLRALPTKVRKRLVVLDLLARQFEIGQRYAESEVNAVLGRYHPDVAALRRYLVEEEFLERREGVYWRAGGTVDS